LIREQFPLKWIFKIKRDAKGVFEKYKARIRGFSQIWGLDFNKTFAPVVRIESIRIILALADLYILHVDCKNAFLHGKRDVELYILQKDFATKNSPIKYYVLTNLYTNSNKLLVFGIYYFMKLL